MIRRFTVMGAIAAALSIGLAGCGGGGDPVAWADKVCGSIAPEVKKLSAQPDIDPTDPAKAKQGLSDFLGNGIGALDKIIEGVNAAGEPPVDGGQELVDKMTAALGNARGAFEKAKGTLDAADVSDPAKLQAAMLQVGQDMSSVAGMQDPTADLKGNAELDKAFNEAPNCKELQ